MADKSSKPEINPGDAIVVASEGNSSSIRPQFGQRIIDSFRRDPQSFTKDLDKTHELENGPHNAPEPPLQRRLKTRHVQMIAIGGSIGKKKNHSYWYLSPLSSPLTSLRDWSFCGLW